MVAVRLFVRMEIPLIESGTDFFSLLQEILGVFVSANQLSHLA